MEGNLASDQNSDKQDHDAGKSAIGSGSSAKRIAANRRNARNSTGPKTASGKARSSRNARRHGMLSISPCILGIESDRAWREHRDELFRIIAPVGYLEELWTTLLAVRIWNLWRSLRQEAQLPAAAIATAEQDLDESWEEGEGKPLDPATVRATAEAASRVAEFLRALPDMGDEERIQTKLAQDAVHFLGDMRCDRAGNPVFREVPKSDNSSFEDRTAGLFRKALQVYAGATQISPEALRSKCICFLQKMVENADDQESEAAGKRARWELGLERERVRRILLEPALMEAMTRSQNGLERSVYKALHEIQRFQAVRRGTPVNPPEVLEVDLTTPNGPSRRS